MAWTQSDLDAIDEVIASGEMTVKYRDREVTYRSMDDLLRARKLILAELGQASTFDRRRRLAKTTKGTDPC